MKTLLQSLIAASLLGGGWVSAQTTYTNFIRQVQFPGGLQKDVSVTAAGQQPSDLAIDPGGARFELWTVANTTPLKSYLLETRYVGTYIPLSTVTIRSEDTTGEIMRTRADRPFYVDVTVTGLLSGATDPEPSKSVKFLRHVQSYGTNGTGITINRTQAILLTQTTIATNGTQNLTFALTSIPGSNRAKVRGEERFSVFSLEDYQAPESQLASQFIQIWPVANGAISGITQNQLVQFSLPAVTLTLNDLYPNSTTYAQVYKGNAVLGTTGKIIPGSSLVINDSVPQNRVLSLINYDSIFDSDGRWTIELLTQTPFGTDRLSSVSFDLDRTINVNGSFTTIE